LVAEKELNGMKKRAKKSSIDRLKGGRWLALQLAYYEALYNDYSELFNELDKINKVSAEDIRRVANKSLQKSNQTTGELVSKEKGE